MCTCHRASGSTIKTGKIYEGGWHHIEAGELPVVMLVKAGTALPHIDLAQISKNMGWYELF